MPPPGRHRLGVSILPRNKGAQGVLRSWGARLAAHRWATRMVPHWAAQTRKKITSQCPCENVPRLRLSLAPTIAELRDTLKTVSG